MNHSILVVICDFLVLSVLSLSLGVSPVNSSFSGSGTRIDDYTANILLDELKVKSLQLDKLRESLLAAQFKFGYAESRAERVKKLNAELAKVNARLNYLEAKLKSRKGEIGKEPKEKLLARLEKERVRRLKVMTEMSEVKAALSFEKAKSQKFANDMGVLRHNVIQRDDELTEKKSLLEDRKKQAEKTKLRLKEITTKLAGSRQHAKTTLLDLSYVRGRLSATEKELAESRSSLSKNQKNLAVNQLELREAQKKIGNLKNILESAVGDLSKTQAVLNTVRNQAENAAQIALKDTIFNLKSDALEKYSQAAVLLKVNVQERRFWFSYDRGGEFYLPRVAIGGEIYLISALELLSGMGRTITRASSISELSYVLCEPKKEKKIASLKTALLSLNADNRVCIAEVAKGNKNSLRLLTYERLKKRGLQDLTLFKDNSFGQESSNLAGRCSLGLTKGDNYLYIRNSVRKTAPELKAEVGDFVMTKQGMFVGIAVEVENFNSGRQQRVKCFVFSDDFNVKNTIEIPLVKAPGDKYFSAFATAVAKINTRLKK